MGASHLVKTKRTLTDELPTGRPMCIQFIPGELRALLLAALVGVHAVRLDGAEAAVDVLPVQPVAVGAAERGAGRASPGKPGLVGFMAVVDFATIDFEACQKYQNWSNFINKSTTES